MIASLLLVDDDPEIRELLGDLLALDGYEVRVAADGIAALRALDVRYPQLVITDLEMPVLDGRAMIFRMFVENLGRENVPVILMSASPHLVEVARAVGTPYALAKPFAVEALLALIRQALDEALPPRPLSIAE